MRLKRDSREARERSLLKWWRTYDEEKRGIGWKGEEERCNERGEGNDVRKKENL